MKSILVRAIASIIIGGLLVAYPEKVTDWLVIVVGCLFLIPGVYSVVSYWTVRKEEGLHVGIPIAGMGSALLGIWMIVDSSFFIKAFMVAVAVLLAVVAINRIVGNVRARAFQVHVPFTFYLFPVLLIVASAYVLSNPLEVAGVPFYIMGIAMIVYGIIELWNTLWLNSKIKVLEQSNTVETEVNQERAVLIDKEDIEDAQIVE